jgi:hypothetical protein
MRGQSKNWKLYGKSATHPTTYFHLSSYASREAAEEAVPVEFGNSRLNVMYEIVLVYLGETINTWNNPNK